MNHRVFVVKTPGSGLRVGEYWIAHDDLEGCVRGRLIPSGQNTWKVVAASTIELPFEEIRPFVQEIDI